MPQKVVYVSNEDLEVWEKAKTINEGSMSQLVNWLIADFVFKSEDGEEESTKAAQKREFVAA